MTAQEWVEIRILVPEALQEEAGIFLTGWSGRGVILEDPEETEYGRRAGVRAYVPRRELAPELRQDLLAYLDRLAALGYPPVPVEQRTIVEEDWERAWQVHFRAKRLTRRFVVCPPWEDYQPVGDELVLKIYPGMAFGTGRHPSTWLCLHLLEEVAREWSRGPAPQVLDVGTGTGILGLAAAKLGGRVLAIDIDPEALAAARENILLNRLQEAMRADEVPLNAIRQQFHLILANLTAPDLLGLAEALVGRLLPGGSLIISGFLRADEPEIRLRYASQGLQLQASRQKEDWVAMSWRR